jgi:diguanylate cyclase (GGDEF)-like protein
MIEFLRHKRVFFSIVVLLIILTLFTSISINYIKDQRDELLFSKKMAEIEFMKANLTNLILQKQKSTIAIGLTIANDKHLSQKITDGVINNYYYSELTENLKKYTLYKNIWIQILDKNATSLYRSWTTKQGDNLIGVRKDLKGVLDAKEISFSVSLGKFDLSLKAMIPIFNNGKFVGVVEVISHFNSISKQLKQYGIDSVVLLKKEYKKKLLYPFTKMFLDDYYIANFNAPLKVREYLKSNGVEQYLNEHYRIENGYLIVAYPLKNVHLDNIAYYIMFTKVDTLSSLDSDFLMFKGGAYILIIFMSLAIITSTLLFYKNKKQRKYYKKIIDISNNIVLINNNERIISVNKVFFRYFNGYKSIEEFKNKHRCICDFFIKEEGYLSRNIEGDFWINYLVNNPDNINKVKVLIEDKEYYFLVNASLISEDSRDYSVVLSDITLAEKYKIELEKLTITDSLTGIGNRRYFHQQLKEKIASAKRYEYDLGIIMLDIDYFKTVNDTYGHDVGDEVLKEYSKLILSHLRENDIFSRIGGEEFMIILPHVNAKEAFRVANKLREKIELNKKIVAITMSFGVTEYIRGEEMDFIFKRVDSALYEAKNSGRNRVVLK